MPKDLKNLKVRVKMFESCADFNRYMEDVTLADIGVININNVGNVIYLYYVEKTETKEEN